MRAKDSKDPAKKSFDATIKTDFDNSLDKIDIISQDIGRVLLNLYNNAFYAVTEKKRTLPSSQGGSEYEPTVSVSTKAVEFPSGDLGV